MISALAHSIVESAPPFTDSEALTLARLLGTAPSK